MTEIRQHLVGTASGLVTDKEIDILQHSPGEEHDLPKRKGVFRPNAANKKRPGPASIRNLPVNLFGAVMGLSGLSLAWRLAARTLDTDPAIGEAIGVVAVIAFLLLAAGYLTKYARYPEAVIAEFRHPVAGNFFGTITISLLLLSSIVGAYSATAGEVIWTLGVATTFSLSAVIASRLLEGRQDPAHAAPAWLIPGVATLDIAVAGGSLPLPWAHEVNFLAVAIGTVLALLFFTMILSRLIHHDPLPAPMKPSMIILIAPFEVGFLAYVNVTGRVDMFAALLFYFGLFLFIVLATKVFRRGIPFGASWWAVSFPMAALSNAALKYAAASDAWPLRAVAGVILLALTAVIAVLFVRTIHYLFNGRLLAH